MTPLMIDSEWSIDRDDAIHVQTRDGDGWTLTVYVADVACGLRPGSTEDLQALQRGRTYYGAVAAATRPMLPPALERALTLSAKAARRTLVLRLEVDPDGAVASTSVGRGTLAGAQAISHTGVVQALADPGHEHNAMLSNAERMARALMNQRREAGALAFYDLTRGWAVDEDGRLVRLDDPERNVGYIIVQEAMIAANTALAGWAVNRDVPIMFRNHVASAVSPSARILAEDLHAAIADGSHAGLEVTRQRLHMVMQAATYGSSVRGHYALNLTAYAHATSPLRRYADVVTQRQVFAAVDGSPLPYTIGEIEEIADRLNAEILRRRESKSEALKERAHRAARAAAGSGTFSHMPPGKMSATIKRAAKEGLYSDALAEEILRRAECDALSPGDLFMVLLVAETPPWLPLKADLVRLLASRPHVTVSVLSLHVQNGGLDPVSYSTRTEGKSPDETFTARASLAQTHSGQRRAPTKKAAQQQAAVSLLAALVGVDDPSGDVSPSAPAASPERVQQAISGHNPMAVINECMQAGYLSDIEWVLKRTGPDHSPKFTARVSAVSVDRGALAATGDAASKSGARERAAAALVAQLQPQG